jgi:hypothetical protein
MIGRGETPPPIAPLFPAERIAMTPPLTEEQREAVVPYRDTLADIVFLAATRYQSELESRGIPSEHIVGPLLAGIYGAAEKFLRLGGADEFAKRLHNAVQTVARDFHFQLTVSN